MVFTPPPPLLPDRIPPGSTPLPAENITKVANTLTGEKVEVEFVWESPGTPCYPVHQYLITISSPEVEEHYSETFEVGQWIEGCGNWVLLMNVG